MIASAIVTCCSILTFISEPGDDSGLDYYAVAVVRRDNRGFDVETLAKKKACNTGLQINYLDILKCKGYQQLLLMC